MKKYASNTIKYIVKLESKIAFYPSLISFFGVVFAFFMYYLESNGISGYLVDHAPLLVVNDTETARSLLTTFVAGLISIMVFSFSLVMILLNQASSNFSPRVLPGLISNRRHQIVLGIYNASLLYSIFTLVAIEPNGNEYQLPGFSVLLAIVSMTFCLGAFIYFIHSISQEIQVNNIMERIFETAENRLQTLITSESEQDHTITFPNTSKWNSITSQRSGYFQDISINTLKEIAKEASVKFEVIPVKGTYMLDGSPIFKCDKKLDDEVLKKTLKAFHFSKSERIEDNYVLAFKQITEIAVKAMSPGINDPGTAVNAIDYLTELFVLRMQKRNVSIVVDDNDTAVLKISTVDFDVLLFQVMAALRTYCKHDLIIVQKLFVMLDSLLKNEKLELDHYKDAIKKELKNLHEDTTSVIKNTSDLETIDAMYKAISN